MSTYSERLSRSTCNTIGDIIDWCHQSVPERHRARPWLQQEVNHGVDLLSSEESLDCYMSAYGDMHVSKCRAAMMNFPFDQLNGSIEIVDWGCGQGIGSATIIDILKQRDLIQWLKRVTLIEPSSQALERAVGNVSKLTNGTVEIDAKNVFMPANSPTQQNTLRPLGYRYANIIHVFSNILDIGSINLAEVAKMVASSHGRHYVLCIGPKNGAAYRIKQFSSVFGKVMNNGNEFFSEIDSAQFGRTKRTGHLYTCMTRCFIYDGSTLNLDRLSLYKQTEKIYNEYDINLLIQNKVLSTQKAWVAYHLENILAVDDIMYIDPVVNEVAVDFIIVRPNKGVLIVNVFEENLNNCRLSEDAKDISTAEKRYQSPIDLINLCQISIKDGIEELLMSTIEDSRNFGLIKKVLVFTENDTNKVKDFFGVQGEHVGYTYLFGNEFIKDRNVSSSLFNKINFVYNNAAFDDVVKRKLAKIISPSWHSYQEGRIGVEPKGAQRELARSRKIQQKISGVAGSGKTHVLAVRAINAMKRTGGDVLVLTYNITLANYLRLRLSEIREDFSWEKIDIYPYHQFFRIRASECELNVKFGSYDEIDFFDNATQHKRYSAIFVDEVQDYTTEWLRIIMRNFLLEPNGEFVVFGDPKQNVYKRPTDDTGEIYLGVIRGDWNHSLRTSHRFTNPRLASLATSFQRQFLSSLPVDNIATTENANNQLNFKVVTYYDLRSSQHSLVDTIINVINNDNNNANDFVVLAYTNGLLRNIDSIYRHRTGKETEVTFVSTEQFDRLKQIHNVRDENTASWKFKRDFEAIERTRRQLFTTDKRCIKMSTIHSFKGWESPSVIVVLESEYEFHRDSLSPVIHEMIYTAITRARENLYIINIGQNPYHNFFNTQSR